jgi:hypothetical protein
VGFFGGMSVSEKKAKHWQILKALSTPSALFMETKLTVVVGAST